MIPVVPLDLEGRIDSRRSLVCLNLQTWIWVVGEFVLVCLFIAGEVKLSLFACGAVAQRRDDGSQMAERQRIDLILCLAC